MGRRFYLSIIGGEKGSCEGGTDTGIKTKAHAVIRHGASLYYFAAARRGTLAGGVFISWKN